MVSQPHLQMTACITDGGLALSAVKLSRNKACLDRVSTNRKYLLEHCAKSTRPDKIPRDICFPIPSIDFEA
jgi:hypothetical protein